ncbi:MAG TPA: DUF4390 domain-containing protein [Acidobacteriota bacterium]|jgi:hypothetical protein|nr:DUF4390 domain-containing protein [Acidobacteriota bacterium]HNR39289.1 DUF4390 domain-containing protein [Acidobacteriota bacterium]HNU01775.1 DUF4390 domain-containing protein [Acidobacteriota bacterium]HPB27273.1 DUF4390 domain-containing protein [Acidobacteriota bacterium]HQO25606.1 DUF4390 domain-containing protein [Acidobacteriota bacterium]
MRIQLAVLLSIWSLLNVLLDEQGELINLNCACESQTVALRCRIRDVDQSALRQLLEGGETIVFRYEAELRGERSVWFDEFCAEATLDKRLSYDPRTRQFFGSTAIENQESSARIFSTLDDAVEWLAAVAEPPLLLKSSGPLKPGGYVQARVVLQRKKLLFVIPVETATPWKRQPVQCP